MMLSNPSMAILLRLGKKTAQSYTLILPPNTPELVKNAHNLMLLASAQQLGVRCNIRTTADIAKKIGETHD